MLRLTLKDRLSRLSVRQACKLLGDEGDKLIMQGGKFPVGSIEENVYLNDDLFRLSVDGAVVTITLMAEAKNIDFLAICIQYAYLVVPEKVIFKRPQIYCVAAFF